MAINSWGSGHDGRGCMNDNLFMGLRLRFDGGGCTNSGRQSILGAPDSMVEDA